jgi:DNA-binding CsgD family transcriptional regulator
MTESPTVLTTALRTVVLLASLEPGITRVDVETALALLGLRADAVEDALLKGLIRIAGARLDPVDLRLAWRVVRSSSSRQRRLAHLALACRTQGSIGRRAFDAMSAGLDAPRAVPAPTPCAPPPLTPQERQIAELAATGAPTREIAGTIYLSPRTVEYHLTRVYRKLGVRSKAELAFAFRA